MFMLLKLKNVGRLKPVEVKIDGLTVICGNNNTGKSTIGKVLYCIFTAFHDIENNIRREKKLLIYRCLWAQLQDPNLRLGRFIDESMDELLEPELELGKDLQLAVEKALKKLSLTKSRQSLEEITNDIRQILQVDKDAVVTTFLRRRLDAEFDGHLGNVNHPKKKTCVELKIRDQAINFHTTGVNEKITIDHYMNLDKQIIYFDDPFLLDHINDLNYFYNDFLVYGHSHQLGDKIRAGKLRNAKTVAVEEVLRNEKLKDIIEKIQQISDGEVVVEDGKIVYRQANLRRSLGISSLSTGIKTFLILKELLMNGDLEQNGIMVIDEPEVHLHPEWQIKFAEVIVLLQKAYGLNIVLTTHSMDFLSALVTYAKEYGIEGVCNYYLTKLDDSENSEDFPLATLQWMNEDIQGLYASVSEPFEKLYQKMDIGEFNV